MPKNYRSKTVKAKKTEKPFEKRKRITKKGSNTEKATKLNLLFGDVRLHTNRGRTVNLGNFNSTRMDVGMSRDLEKGEEMYDTFNVMDEFLTKYLDRWANALDILDE